MTNNYDHEFTNGSIIQAVCSQGFLVLFCMLVIIIFIVLAVNMLNSSALYIQLKF